MRSTPRRRSPACCASDAGAGSSIKLELWALSAAAFGKFVAAIPPPLGIGTVRLADGRGVKGFVVEPVADRGRARYFRLRRLAGVHGGEGGIVVPPCPGRGAALRAAPQSRDPYVDGPRAARVFRWSDRITCIHMSGLLMRFGGRWPRWFSAMRVPNTAATFTGQWVPRIFSHIGSIDPTICLLLQLRPNRWATSPTG